MLFGCGQENNSGTIRTDGQINTNGGYNNGGGGTNNGQTCGTVYADSDGFNKYYSFNTDAGQYNLQPGDQRTHSILNQIPIGQYANCTCLTQSGPLQNNTFVGIDLTQPCY